MLAGGDVVNWDQEHRLMLDHRSLPNTNIVDLVAHLLHPHDDRLEDPKGFTLFIQTLNDIKLESELVQNELVKDMLDDNDSDSEDESDDDVVDDDNEDDSNQQNDDNENEDDDHENEDDDNENEDDDADEEK